MTRLSLIAGVARDGGIGRDNELLWRLPEDMARFKALTMGHPVIMGRKTWDSIPLKFRPLPGRRNIVLSRDSSLQLVGAEVVGSLNEAVAACADSTDVFIMGGAQIYAEALPIADRLELTEIDATFDADVFFPAWDRTAFTEASRETKTAPQGWRFDFVTYNKIIRR